MTAIADNRQYILAKIAKAALAAGRKPEDIALLAVAKTFPPAAMLPLLAAGQRAFGENRVQEAKAKWPALRAQFPDIELHLIGPLQSNKAAEAVALFEVIESVDRDKIARILAEECRRQGRRLQFYVEVNIGSEQQKAGIMPPQTVEFVTHCRAVYGLDIIGLMCVPPRGENAGPYFALLERLAQQAGVKKLSQGMSQDYETAIAFGATQVRLGSALFGTRSPAGAKL
ncbi:MAG: YggS family pyridoxal phosphate-dependent enzyme [Candidatus Tokpelaia sp.]|nr:MAG: YggS family pyridoxal phosphate-dependent enzyme [Candidatus Tokpelaia sp.]KAA6206196.1 MAG: YggS family pyridoxal phosphate-dependent enzyme [Candidatus Tokpelaia sp.]